MYIKNRYDKNGDIVPNPISYVPKSPELKEFLAAIYSNDTPHFDQNNRSNLG